MEGFSFTINDYKWPLYFPIQVKKGDRVEMTFHNKMIMKHNFLHGSGHVMHLHGHTFQVTEINGEKINGAMRDTIVVPPHGTVKIVFDANNSGNWMLHCHVLYHAAAGMMTILNYEEVPLVNPSNLKFV